MSTPDGSIVLPQAPRTRRGALRLRLAEQVSGNHLDGGWWPRSRDLAVELADLIDHYPSSLSRIVRVQVSPPDWDSPPDRVQVGGGHVNVASFPDDDTHLILLRASDRTVLRVLVVPPDFSDDQGDEALLAAATPGNSHSAAALLATVTEYPDIDPFDHWKDDGGSWWGPDAVAPSFRASR